MSCAQLATATTTCIAARVGSPVATGAAWLCMDDIETLSNAQGLEMQGQPCPACGTALDANGVCTSATCERGTREAGRITRNLWKILAERSADPFVATVSLQTICGSTGTPAFDARLPDYLNREILAEVVQHANVRHVDSDDLRRFMLRWIKAS